jgi:hypothetical protein
MPLQWMSKSQKGPVSQFLIEELSEFDYVHQYIEGKSKSIPDAISRYPLLGPQHLSPRGLLHSVEEVLKRIPVAIKKSTTVHVHSGPDAADVKRLLQDWMDSRSAVQSLAPVRTGQPQKSDFALMVPRPETAPVTLALCLLSPVPFAILVPIDLAALSYEPSIFPDAPHEEIRVRFDAAGKLTILASQMLWIIGNVPRCTPVEIFASALSTPVPTACIPDDSFVEPVPRTVESWIEAQQTDPEFAALLSKIPDAAVRDGLSIWAPNDKVPKIIVPPSVQEPLVRNVPGTSEDAPFGICKNRR